MITESQRNYEVSIWTLQDSFITVLKPTNLEFKGQIQDPDMVLKDDGTLNFNFSIPMYIHSFPIPYNTNEPLADKIENPIWYTTQNGVIAASMRKLKVIFDKFNDPTVFEFLITKVTETHEKGQLICKVESESLAFHELGHQGVVINLSADDFTTEYNEWWENGHDPETEPKNNINYWTEKALRFTNWQYEVQMNYSGYVGRQSDIIYDDAYVADWKLSLDGNNLTSNRVEDACEKCRNISISDSNLYNITQKLAEEFEVYCKYKYEYDSSFHIIGRKIIYYNSFIQEQNGAYDITYPYDTDKITRTMDGTDICTKLYVKKVEDDTAPAGYISIMSTAANPSGEDYILNFDYLHKIGTITEEQYAEIKPYEIAMRKFNHELEELSTKMADAQLRLVEYDATISITTTSINQYDSQINDNLKLLKAITDDTGYIHLTQATAAHGTLVPDADFQDKFYKINISQKGVVHDAFVIHKVSEDSTATIDTDKAYIKIFAARDSIGDTTPYSGGSGDEDLQIKPDGLKLKDDGYGNIIGITGFAPSTEIKSYYLIFSYCPKLYYENIITKFETKKKAEEQVLSKAQQLKADTEKDYNNWKERYDALILEKEAAIRRFNILMGPALREGQWNPENYKDYGTKGEAKVRTGGITDFTKPVSTNNLVSFIWDDEPFEGEQKTYQLIGIDMGVENYPFIRLTNADLIAMRDHNAFDKLCFFYNELGRDDTWCELRIGAQMKLAFKQFNENNSSKIQAVLLLTDLGVGNYASINALGNQWKILGFSKTEIIEDPTKPGILNSTIVTTRTGIMKIGQKIVLELDNNYTNSTEELENGMFKRIFTNPLVYPRIKINSPSLKTTELKVSRSSDEFDFQIKYVHAYHTDEAVYLSVTLASDQDGNNIKILPTYIPYNADGTLNTNGAWYSGKDSGTINYENWSNWENGIVNRFLAFGNPYRRQRRSFLLDVSAFKVVNGTVQPTAIATHRITIDLSQDVDAEYTYSDDLKFNLDMYTDYSVLLREQAYYLTLKPEILLQYGADAFKVIYEISNADTNIYLDAREVSQTNAYPQASYEVAVSLFGRKIDFKTYNLIGQIVNINDLDLKFEHVQGYISEVDLKLDKPWEDSIKIQNYKNKFEDLFSTIIASSNIVQAKAAIYDKAVSLFNSDGTLKDEVIKTTLGKVNLQYAFNKGKLTISEENGIWAVSEDGVVAMSGGGIFTATEKDSTGNWIWNTGIIPSGINASLINSGQLDTNLVRIFAGDNLRFQMNGDGLFAYKPNSDGSPILNQYVVHNSEGLFLKGPQRDNAAKIINRVAIDWDGLTLKNWAGNTTFFADAETGNLWVSGTVSAESFKIVPTDAEWREATTGVSLDEYTAILLSQRGSLVQETLGYFFEKAGAVLEAAMGAQSDLAELLDSSSGVLSGFTEHLPSMTTQHYDGIRVWNFKAGDTWTVNGKSYVASVSWDKIYSSENAAKAATLSTDGWVLVNSEYKYAAVTGTNLDINANTGVINLNATSTINLNANQAINLSSGKAITLNTEGTIQLGGSHIDIVGNKNVRIGGAKIYLGSADSTGGEIHITTSAYNANNSVSAIDLTSSGISIASGAKIRIISTSTDDGIEIGSSANNTANLIRLNSEEGIWLGSSKGITLFTESNGTGSAVKIAPKQILFGVGSAGSVSGTSSNTVVEITQEYLIIGTGDQYNNLRTSGAILPTSPTATAGIKIMPDSISFATGSGNTRSYIGMSSNGVEIYHGTSSEQQNGSYIKLLTSGVSIGSSMNFDVNSSNIQIFSEGVTETINGSQSPNTYFVLGSNLTQSNRDAKLWFANETLNVKGRITAEELVIASGANVSGVLTEHQSLDAYAKTDLTKALTSQSGNNSVTLNSNGLWIVGQNGLSAFDAASSSLGFYHKTQASDSTWISDLIYSNGTLWIGGNGGWKISPKIGNTPASIYNNLSTFGSAGSPDGGIYIGTDGISVNNLIKLSNSGIFTIYRGLTNSEEDREPVFSVSRDSTDSSKFNITFGKGVSFGDFILPEWNGGTGARTLTNNGVYKANSKNSLPSDVVNGSLGIVYQNEIATASGTLTATMDLTNTSPTFAKVRSSTNTWYNLTRYWNHGMLNVSDDKTYQGAIVGDNTNLDRYARVGYGTNSNYQSAICVLVKFRTDGINFNKINISFDWCTHPGTTFTSPPFDRQTKVTGSLKVKLYKDNTDYSTIPFIFTPNINGDNAVRVSSGTIQSQVLNLTTPISNTTVANYYLVFYTTDPYSLMFIKPSSIKVDSITASGSTNTAELYIRSANQWVKVAQPVT